MYTLTRVYISDKSKDNKPFVDKNGKPFSRVAIQTSQTGDEWYSCLSYKDTDPERKLMQGTDVDIELFESNGFKNFKLPSRLDLLERRMDSIESRMNLVEMTDANKRSDNIKLPTEEKAEETTIDDVPF